MVGEAWLQAAIIESGMITFSTAKMKQEHRTLDRVRV